MPQFTWLSQPCSKTEPNIVASSEDGERAVCRERHQTSMLGLPVSTMVSSAVDVTQRLPKEATPHSMARVGQAIL